MQLLPPRTETADLGDNVTVEWRCNTTAKAQVGRVVFEALPEGNAAASMALMAALPKLVTRGVIIGWTGITDEHGRPVPLSADAIERLPDEASIGLASALVEWYTRDALTDAAVEADVPDPLQEQDERL